MVAESQPPPVTVTAELGSLNAKPNEGSRFIGSSSGVFFVKTVRNAFSAASNFTQDEEKSTQLDEEIVVGSDGASDDGSRAEEEGSTHRHLQLYDTEGIHNAIGYPPERELATELTMSYFRTWHKLFPFLHGPSFSQGLESFYATESPKYEIEHITTAVVFQCVFNIASLDRPDLPMPPRSKIRSPKGIFFLLGFLVQKHDIPSVQALLACQIHLLAIMALRPASTVGGLITRASLHSGLHRCPFRYEQLSHHECDIRKRVWWTAYSIDRYLTQALGHPLGIQDSDIDVCLPGGKESHRRVIHDRRTSRDPTTQLLLHMPSVAGPNEGRQDVPDSASVMPHTPDPETKRRREAALANYAQYSKLIGRVLEVFHKSIHTRRADRNTILELNSDIDSWWNDLPSHLQDLTPGVRADTTDLSAFFNILYHQLILQVNRPSLSLDPLSPEFRSGCQQCIKAGRAIIYLLKEHSAASQTRFWPGFLSAVWMSGLVIAFACQLGWYNVDKCRSELNACLSILDSMIPRWHTAKHCRIALASLLTDINSKRQPFTSQTKITHGDSSSYHPDSLASAGATGLSAKRRRLNGTGEGHSTANQANQSVPAEYELPLPQQPILIPQDLSQNTSPGGTGMSTAQAQFDLEGLNLSPATQQPTDPGDSRRSNEGRMDYPTMVYSNSNHNALMRSPESAWSNSLPGQANMALPGPYLDDQLLGGFEYNISDVFEGATWENLMAFMGQDGG